MKPISLLTRAARAGALAAIPLLFAAPLAAQGYYTAPQSAPPTYSYGPTPSGPPVFSGLDCSRCGGIGTFCVINPVRFEYTCAPQGTYACAGISGTSACRYGTMCWDGNCR